MDISELKSAAESRLPARMAQAIIRYVDQGCSVGDFLTAVLDNNLREAIGRADDWNRDNLYQYVAILWQYAPAGCWGSPEKRKSWQATGGIMGQVPRPDPVAASLAVVDLAARAMGPKPDDNAIDPDDEGNPAGTELDGKPLGTRTDCERFGDGASI